MRVEPATGTGHGVDGNGGLRRQAVALAILVCQLLHTGEGFIGA